jgi:hypothetical protein
MYRCFGLSLEVAWKCLVDKYCFCWYFKAILQAKNQYFSAIGYMPKVRSNESIAYNYG